MIKKTAIILAILILVGSSLPVTVSLADSSSGLEQFLDIFTKMDVEKRELGASVLNVYLQNGDSGIVSLKNDLGSMLTDSNIKTLNSMGYSVDDIKSELDRLNSWSMDERTQLVGYISSGDTRGISNLISSAGQSTPPISGGGSIGGGTAIPPKEIDKEEPKKEDLIDVLFKDIDGHKNEKDIIYLAERGIIEGKSPQKYDPDGNLTRAEFMTLIHKVLGIKPTNDNPLEFKDVTVKSWYYKYIKAAFDNKIISGTSPTTFSPNDKVSREAMVSILVRILKNKEIIYTLEKLDEDILNYEDADKISDWAMQDMSYGVTYGLIAGRTSTTINPQDPATRGEAAEIIKRLLMLIEK